MTIVLPLHSQSYYLCHFSETCAVKFVFCVCENMAVKNSCCCKNNVRARRTTSFLLFSLDVTFLFSSSSFWKNQIIIHKQ